MHSWPQMTHGQPIWPPTLKHAQQVVTAEHVGKRRPIRAKIGSLKCDAWKALVWRWSVKLRRRLCEAPFLRNYGYGEEIIRSYPSSTLNTINGVSIGRFRGCVKTLRHDQVRRVLSLEWEYLASPENIDTGWERMGITCFKYDVECVDNSRNVSQNCQENVDE